MLEAGWSNVDEATEYPHIVSVPEVTCGDGIVIEHETCDEGVIRQGCDLTCTGSKPGWSCTGGDSSNPSVCETICGDKIKLVEEQCDDGNTDDDDGCSSVCETETGWDNI